MKKLVVLKLDGDLEHTVRVTLEIGVEGGRPSTEIIGQLPPCVDLHAAIEQWRSNYRSISNSRIKVGKIVYDGSITQWREDCQKSASELRSHFNSWLKSESLRPIREKWLQQLNPDDEVRVLIRTSSLPLLKLPWHLWDLVEDYPKAEVALSTPDLNLPTSQKTPTYRDKVRILAILGNSNGIDVQKDRQLLENLPDAETTFLVEPQRQDINDSLWNHWDILFFAGHSRTEGEKGRIYINQTDSLTIAELKYALRNAVAQGLQLAIFNSCDGLGLAFELQALHIPQMIVMREQVPDKVAQDFLSYFLTAFADGKSFYLAEREAREKLHGLEHEFPCASWLPVIFQNPATIPPTWFSLGRRPTDKCPYRGLFAFREEDAPFFFGRENFTDILTDAVQKQPLVAVIGPSGSGKSSVVFAGLIPRLRQQGSWHIVSFRPGDRPFRALAAALVSQNSSHMSLSDRLREIRKLANYLWQEDDALRDVVDDIVWKDPTTRLLLVADQFEELYTLCRDSQERQVFLDILLEAAKLSPDFTLVITLRADFLGQALSYRPFADALQYADLKLGPMNQEELLAAVEQPATMLGVTIESGLTERILDAVSAEPGDLPLLEFALHQLWAKQRDAQLTHAAYEEIGGVEAALARYAEEAYGRLNEEEKERARQLFIQLVRPGEGTEDTRRLATRAEVGEENWDLVTRLATARLVVSSRDEATGEETVDLVHEALIKGWECLRVWIELDRAFRTWQERLRATIQQWETSGRDRGALLRGTPLAEAEGWLQSRSVELNPKERSFIEQSRLVQSRQRRRLVFGLSVGLAGALALAGIGSLQWQRAEYERKGSLARQLAFQSEFLRNQRENMLPRSVLLAVEAMQRFPSPVAEQVLRESVPLLPRPVAKLPKGSDVIAFSPDEKYLVMSGSSENGSNQCLLWSVSSDREIARLEAHQSKDRCRVVVFSPNSKYLVTTNSDDTTLVWETSGGRKVTHLEDKGIWKVAFSPDSKFLATAGLDDTAWVWETTSGRKVMSVKQDEIFNLWGTDKGSEVAFLRRTGEPKEPDKIVVTVGGRDRVIASRDAEGTVRVRVWEPSGSREVGLVKLGRKIWSLTAVSPDGKYFVTDTNGFAQVWETTSGLEVARVRGLTGTTFSATNAISPNGKYLATMYSDDFGPPWLLDLSSHYKVAHTMKHEDAVKAVVFSPDGKYLVTASGDKTAQVWEATSGREVVPLKHGDSVVSIAFSRDGKYLVTTSWDGTARVWETTSGREITRIITEEAAILNTFKKFRQPSGYDEFRYENTIAISPDGKYLAKVGLDRTIRMWEVSSGHEVMRLKNDTPYIVKLNKLDPPNFSAITFSPDGRYLATITNGWKSKKASSHDLKASSIRVWEVNSGREVVHINNDSFDVRTISFSPDGRYLATTSHGFPHGDSSNVTLWETSTGRKITYLQRILDAENLISYPIVNTIAFSPDGRYLAGTDSDKTTWVWEVTTGRGVAYMFHEDSVNAIAFSPDGKYLATVSKDKTSRVWQIPSSSGREITSNVSYLENSHTTTYQERQTIDVREAVEVARINHQDNVVAVAFSPDGKYLATGSDDKTARVQLWRREDLMAEACARLTRNLAENEWKQYLPSEPFHKTCPNLPVPTDNDVQKELR